MRASLGVPAGAPLAGIIARLTEQKGHRYLFDALAATPALATLHLLVVGDGELRDELRAQVRRLGLSSRVHFLGARRDLGDLLAAIDVFVMPSLWEGLPLSMVLAMGAGLPVVATACRRHSRSGARTARPACSCRRPTRRRSARRSRAWSSDPALATTARRRRGRLRPAAVRRGRLRRVVTGLYDRLLAAEADAHEARHRLSHAVLARRRRHAARGRRIVRALCRFAGAVLRRDFAVRAGPRRRRAARARRFAPTNVTLAPLPHFDGPVQFYPRLPIDGAAHRALRPRASIVLHCRVPTPGGGRRLRSAHGSSAGRAFCSSSATCGRCCRRCRIAGVKRLLWRAYTAFEELNVQWMANHVADVRQRRRARARSISRPGHAVIKTQTTTIDADDDRDARGHLRRAADPAADRQPDRSAQGPARAAGGGAACSPRLAATSTLDIVGPVVGAPGEEERAAIASLARRALAVADRVSLLGPVPLDRLLPRYRDYDIFVLPTLPGEGIPRVLLEAMAAGLPIVTSRVSGIPSLITHEQQRPSRRGAIGAGRRRRRRCGSSRDAPLRRRLIARRLRDRARAHAGGAGRADDAGRLGAG